MEVMEEKTKEGRQDETVTRDGKRGSFSQFFNQVKLEPPKETIILKL